DTDCNVCGDARTDWFHCKVIEGGIQINEFRGTTDRLVIPSEINNLPVIAIANYACSYNDTLVSVEIPDTVKTISGYAFRNCPNLQSIKLPSDLEIINRYMFYECTSLTEIEIPASVKVIDEYAFARSGLTSLVLPEGVEAVNTFAFFRCVRMEEVFVSGTVSTIGEYAFFGCDELVDTWFTGTYEQLDNLKIAPNNAPLGGLRIDDLPTVYVSRVKAEAGNRVAVTVSIKNNPGVAVMKLKVGYDAAAMTLVDVVDGGILGTAMHAKTDADLQKQPYTVSWMNFTATKDFSENGVLVTLYFELSEDADGAYAITLNYGKNDILNTTVQEVPFATSDGKVTVS
ncbi:MAG: leucine-rich repeat protein, partial [Clostridia bacterium]|nr:leucine-rich repeat protein [Clostridia bacterium]